MPDVSPVISRVVPDGTVMPLSTIVAHDFFEALAADALVNVQEARFSMALLSLGAGVGIGAGTSRYQCCHACQQARAELDANHDEDEWEKDDKRVEGKTIDKKRRWLGGRKSRVRDKKVDLPRRTLYISEPVETGPALKEVKHA